MLYNKGQDKLKRREPGMKLARYLSLAGVASRRKCEELIRQGLVEVNGVVVNTPAERVSPQDHICYKSQEIQLPRQFLYLLLNKPSGVITTMSDPHADRTI